MFSSPNKSSDALSQSNAGSGSKGKTLLQQALTPKDAAAQPAGIKIKERKFENGDKYHGGWLNGLPEGEGKYDWSDGSFYEGGWKAGHKHGVGKYTWNSGASYQGEWQDGFMHGVGSFEAPDGSKYQGGWREDLKHGLGRKIYANGDVYEGLWSSGKPEGPGRYIWVDFNEYDGEWRGGRLHGQGTFVWKTGERYDGEWKDGQEDGVGVFTFRDSSTYEGFWRRGRKHGVGIFRPASNTLPPRTRSIAGLRLDSTRGIANHTGSSSAANHIGGRSAFADAAAAAAAVPDEAAAAYAQPKQPKGPSEVHLEPQPQPQPQLEPGSSRSVASMANADRRQLQHQNSKRGDVVLVKEYNEGKLVRQQPLSAADVAAIGGALGSASSSSAGGTSSSPTAAAAAAAAAAGSGSSHQQHHRGSSSKQQVTPLGEVVYQEHSAYDLMVQLQLGIRWSVTSAALDYTIPAAMRTGLQPPDYATTITQEFPRAGSRSTPVHPAADFVWKDYAPAAFRMLRELAGVQQHDFISQLCGDQALRLLASPGKSGAMFFLSADERFIVKTITRDEGKLLLSLLQRYTEHMRKYPNSLLVRFYGLHRVSSPPGGIRKKVRFVVMGNIFCTGLPIHRRYDLKGSTNGRTVGPAAAKNPAVTTILKDLDLKQCFKLEDGWNGRLSEQLAADTGLLSAAGIMDYSLLLGVHERARNMPTKGLAPGDRNFLEHDTQADRTAAMLRLEAQLSKLKLEPWVCSALKELGTANLLAGLAGGASRPGQSGRLALVRSPTLVLATRPTRSSSGSRPLSLVPGAADDLSQSMGLHKVTLGVNMAATALPLADAPGSSSSKVAEGSQQQQDASGQDVVLYFGVIDILQMFTFRKRLESGVRRLTAGVQSISAVAPAYYAARFKKFLSKVFV